MNGRRVLFCCAIGLVLALQGSVVFGATYKLEKIASPASGVPDSVSGSLQSEGYRVADDSGKALCELWTRKEIAVSGKPVSSGGKYSGLHTGSLVAVMKFPSDATDYRGQPIKAGTYTLRYALMPQDGNHMGVAPTVDFLLLIPTSDDQKDPDAELAFKDVVDLSRKATGTNHPGIIYLPPPPDSVQEPVLEKNDANQWVLKFKISLKPSGELLIGIIVVGQFEG